MTVRLRTTSPQGNVVQKGQSSSTGGYMKIDMDDGRVACGVIGSSGSLHLRSARSIADGAWHEVRCVRRADEMVLSVDAVVVDRQPWRRPATVANTWPVTIAGKSSCNQASVGCDYFSGDIDRVLLERSGDLLAPSRDDPAPHDPADHDHDRRPDHDGAPRSEHHDDDRPPGDRHDRRTRDREVSGLS